MSNLNLRATPPELNFTGNDIIWKLGTTNYLNTNGTSSQLHLLFSSTGPAEGDTMTISFMNFSLVFTFSATDDESGLILPLKGADDWDTYLEAVKETLENNYTLDKYFSILAGGTGSEYIYIQSKEKGSIYTMTFSTDSANISEDNNITGTDVVLRDNYKLMNRLNYYDNDSSSWKLMEHEERISGKITSFMEFIINIKPYVQQLCKKKFTFPGQTGIISRKHDLYVRKLFIEYAETFDYTVKKIFDTKDSPVYIIPAALDHMTLAKNNESGTTPAQWLDYRSDFLTNQPREKYATLNQLELLSYLVAQDDISELNLKAHITFVGGNEATQTFDTKAVSQYDKVEYDLTLFRLSLSNYDPTGGSADPAVFEYWLEDQNDNQITVKRKLIITEEARFNRVFIFRNNFGCFDTVRLTGKASRESDFERSNVEQGIYESDVTRTTFKRMTDIVSETQKITVNSGWLSKASTQPDAYRDYLRGLAMSKEVYEIIGGKLYPSIVLSGSLVNSKDDEQLQAVEFEMARAYTDEHFVRDRTLVPEQYFSSEFNYRFITK